MDAHNLRREGPKWSLSRVCRPVVADSHHFDEEQDCGCGSSLNWKVVSGSASSLKWIAGSRSGSGSELNWCGSATLVYSLDKSNCVETVRKNRVQSEIILINCPKVCFYVLCCALSKPKTDILVWHFSNHPYFQSWTRLFATPDANRTHAETVT